MKNINWGVRLKNKTFLAAAIALVITFVYDWLAILEIVPAIEQSLVLTLVDGVLTMMVAMGVIVDPTTKGISDSKRALEYIEPA